MPHIQLEVCLASEHLLSEIAALQRLINQKGPNTKEVAERGRGSEAAICAPSNGDAPQPRVGRVQSVHAMIKAPPIQLRGL
ncbi:hypothetical protein EYF80_044903 [Liparis tanakae]|uniref:Uncharacterized protein n=1 Tax=Liparis tanakae TaxID=230148 RepID=A0A4Z2FUJ0_9TELE|nr:hypothetical protein EYF80_044903 [Liparis tanakae]